MSGLCKVGLRELVDIKWLLVPPNVWSYFTYLSRFPSGISQLVFLFHSFWMAHSHTQPNDVVMYHWTWSSAMLWVFLLLPVLFGNGCKQPTPCCCCLFHSSNSPPTKTSQHVLSMHIQCNYSCQVIIARVFPMQFVFCTHLIYCILLRLLKKMNKKIPNPLPYVSRSTICNTWKVNILLCFDKVSAGIMLII